MVDNMKCPGCGSIKIWKKGTVPTRQGPKVRYICYSCGRSFYAPVEKKQVRKSRAKKVAS